MNIENVKVQKSSIQEMCKNPQTEIEKNKKDSDTNVLLSRDCVEISEEGRKKAFTMKKDNADSNILENEAQQSNKSKEGNELETVNVDKLKLDIHKKKAELKAKEAKLSQAMQAAENDPSQEAQMKNLQYQVSQLKKETSSMQSKINISL